jgi:hypothetical protein
MENSIFKKSHSDLILFEQKIKMVYINELMWKDDDFDKTVRLAMFKALKKKPSLSKVISFGDMDEMSILDMNNPIEK